MHYVIGDVHGCYDELTRLIEIVEKRDSEARFIFVGDWPDRGKDVYKTLQWMVEHITTDGKYQSVRGNHDQLCIDWFRDVFEPWFNDSENNLWTDTMYDFSEVVKNDYKCDFEAVRKVIDTMQLMPFNKLLEITTNNGRRIKYRIMHGWHNNSLSDAENRRNNLESRQHYWGNMSGNGEIYVHGHTPTIMQDYNLRGTDDRRGFICYRYDTINVDGGCCYLPYYFNNVCMLCAICLETLEEIYPYTVEERFERAYEYMDGFNNDFRKGGKYEEEFKEACRKQFYDNNSEIKENYYRQQILKKF